MKHVVIIGGGITGLTSAFYLQKQMQVTGQYLQITVLEADSRLGGKISTVHKDGCLVETGPDSFLARKASASQLVEDVGLSDDLIKNKTGQAFVLNDDKLYPLPAQSVMGVPVTISGFVGNPMLSWQAKFRTAWDFLLPPIKGGSDVSAGNFFRYRFGNDTVERLIEPLLSGVYGGDLDRLSLWSTFPQFYELEQSEHSVIRGLNKERQPGGQKERKSKFLTLKHGLSSLVQAVEEQLSHVIIKKRTKVEQVQKHADSYYITLDNGETLMADAVISTAPHQQSVQYLPAEPYFQPLSAVRPTTVATIVVAFAASDVAGMQDGTGFVVSRRAGFDITACTWTQQKWPHTTPHNKVLFRCYVGKPDDEAIVDESDEALTKVVLRDLRRVLAIKNNPLFSVVTRWYDAMPQYIVGHTSWWYHLQQQTAQAYPGLYFAGASYAGVGVPDCIRQGREAAVSAADFLELF